jgi:hypothetical protein
MALEALGAKQIAGQVALNTAQGVGSSGPIGRAQDYILNKGIPNRMLEPGDIIALYNKSIIDKQQAIDWMEYHGYKPEHTNNLLILSKQDIPIADYIVLYRRGLIDLSTLTRISENQGLSRDVFERLLKSTEYVPGISDVIRFAVKDVYTGGKVTEELYRDYPGANFTKAALANGMDELTAKQYWAAHWELPSPTQVFEMLHRQLITDAEVDEYLKQADYSPFWRPLMKKISYNTLTRVDVRRCYQIGVLDAEGVYKAYRDGGYDDVNARFLTEFTVADVSDENNGVTKALVISSYKKGLIDRDEAVQYLERIKYPIDVITLVLDQADYDLMVSELNAAEAQLEENFLDGSMSIEEVRDTIRKYNVSETYVTKLTNKLSLKKFTKIKRPTVADLKRWLKAGSITEGDFIKRLTNYGYTEIDAMLYAKETTTDPTMAGG